MQLGGKVYIHILLYCICCVLSAVPVVEFETNTYSVQFPQSTVSLCLIYNNTSEGEYAQFAVKVSVTKTGHIIIL